MMYPHRLAYYVDALRSGWGLPIRDEMPRTCGNLAAIFVAPAAELANTQRNRIF
jgi:hypothetical protein